MKDNRMQQLIIFVVYVLQLLYCFSVNVKESDLILRHNRHRKNARTPSTPSWENCFSIFNKIKKRMG